jgi:PelA/Pel-15E family pectate lyase
MTVDQIRHNVWIILLLFAYGLPSFPQKDEKAKNMTAIDVMGFWDSSHHWYDIRDEDRIVLPLPDQQRYKPTDIKKIADNILLFQKTNGGWPKNYDMLAVLTPNQKEAVEASRHDTMATTFDNGATHSQVLYLAKAYARIGDDRYKEACLRGLDFILSAQYPNGGWPQFYPDTSGYRKYITFNDGAMIGVMEVLEAIVQDKPFFSFVDNERRQKVKAAFDKGVSCILKTQITGNGTLTAWCQQHDNVDFLPRSARSFELASICNQQGAEIVLFLVSLRHPSKGIVTSVGSAVKWFKRSRILGIRINTIHPPKKDYRYHTTTIDKVVVKDPKAPPIWARFYELGTDRPLFSSRDGKPVYSLAEVDRERRTGYVWHTYAPEEVLEDYAGWRKRVE